MSTVAFMVPGQPQGKGRPRVGRGHPLKATDEQITAAYAAAGSCKEAAKSLGMCSQSVHERLVRLGINKPINIFTDADRAVLLTDYQKYADAGRLDDLAIRLGRTKHFIARQAKQMGLTNTKRSRSYLSQALSLKQIKWLKTNEHPKGMLGKTHTADVKKHLGILSTERWAAMSEDERSDFVMKQLKARDAAGGLARQRPETSWKAGWREVADRRIYFRSRWEANYGRYLEWLRMRGDIADWEHEPETFWFEEIKRGCRSYLPDFKVTENCGAVVYHEVKGWMDDRSKTKINRMRIYHPAVKLVVIEKKQYTEILKKVSSLVPGWEQ